MLNSPFFTSLLSKSLVESMIIPITIHATDKGQCIAVPPANNSAGKDGFVSVSAP